MTEDEIKAIRTIYDRGYTVTAANDIPKLLDEIERLRKQNNALQATYEACKAVLYDLDCDCAEIVGQTVEQLEEAVALVEKQGDAAAPREREELERLRAALRDIASGDYSDPFCQRTPEQRARDALKE